MIGREDLEQFIARLESEGVQSREVQPGVWVGPPPPAPPEVVVHFTPPVLVLRVKVMQLGPGNKREQLYRHLLELNASDLVHGSYGVDGDSVVLSAAPPL